MARVTRSSTAAVALCAIGAPMFETGARYSIGDGLSAGPSLQCGAGQIGGTRCLTPRAFGWALTP